MHFYEGHGRSLTKAITFRLCILASDLSIILFITHKFDQAIGLILLTNLASTAIYFIHERVWNQIHWGKKDVTVSSPQQPHQEQTL
jgi:adenylylsulfate kinase